MLSRIRNIALHSLFLSTEVEGMIITEYGENIFLKKLILEDNPKFAAIVKLPSTFLKE